MLRFRSVSLLLHDSISISSTNFTHPIFGRGAINNGTTPLTTIAGFDHMNLRWLSSSLTEPSSTSAKSLITGNDSVHSTMKISKTSSKSWRNKPLFRRQGDVRFKTGAEAAQLLVNEVARRDSHEGFFMDSVKSNLFCLASLFDRNPKYAFVAKTLLEPERHIQFRVAWVDDVGVVRMNRGFRIQYNSSIAPYCGELHFGSHINCSVMKSLGFDTVFSNALTGFDIGAAVGGSDFHPLDKSEAEMQRFCQSYMTELVKYIGPGQDTPWMGLGVGKSEMGYLFGQYKRINTKSGAEGHSFLSGDFHEVRILVAD
jgi:glutamate dehydrogenase (NADP+)